MATGGPGASGSVALGGADSVSAPATDAAAAPWHWTTGDRLGGVRVMLPAEPGSTVLAVDPVLAGNLVPLLPVTAVVEPGAAGVEAGSADLLVIDERLHDPASLAGCLRPDGCLVVIGSRGPYVVYPSLERPESIWRRGWPVQHGADPVAWLRRRVGLRWRPSVSRLRLESPAAWHEATRSAQAGPPPAPSLAEVVAGDVGRAVGRPARLVGVVTAGQTILRIATDAGDLAVRLRMRQHGRPADLAASVAAEVPGLADWLPRVQARGTTAGCPWTASLWVRGRTPRRPWAWADHRRGWKAADTVADLLAAHPTGSTDEGWARRWCATADLVPADLRATWTHEMRILDDGIPTAWCHGDLWLGNLLDDHDRVRVVDWDNASRDAPAGLDRLLLPAMREAVHPDDTVVAELMSFVDEPDSIGETVVAGRRWADWERPHRIALALAAVVLHLRNRSVHDLGGGYLEDARTAVGAALTREPEAAPPPSHALASTEAEPSAGSGEPTASGEPAGSRASGDTDAGRTTRGALWLATSSIIVKASQTLVLLILAATLTPEALGLVALGTLVANASAMVATLGTANALVYWRGGEARADRAARTAVTLGLFSGAALTALAWVSAPWLADGLGAADGGVEVIRGLTVTLPLLAVAAVTNELLRRRLQFLRRIIPDAVSAVVGAAVAIVLVFDGMGVMALVAGQIVQGVLALLLAWCVHPVVRPGWRREDARGLLAYGGPYASGSLLQLVQLNVDYLAVSIVLGASALGQYSLAFRLAFMPYLMIAVVITGAAFPYLCRIRRAHLADASVAVMSATLSAVTPVCVGLLLLADHLTLLGEQWSPGVPVVAVLAGYAWLLSLAQLVHTSLNAWGRPTVAMMLRLAHLLLLVVTLLVVTRHGVVAVATAQVGVALAVAGLSLLAMRLLVPGFAVTSLLRSLRPLVAGMVVMVAAVAATRLLLSGLGVSVVTLVVTGVVGLGVYVGSQLLLDRERFAALVGMVRGTR